MKILSECMDKKHISYGCGVRKLQGEAQYMHADAKSGKKTTVVGMNGWEDEMVLKDWGGWRKACIGIYGMACTNFDTSMLPAELRRSEFWVWAAKKSSRTGKWNLDLSKKKNYSYVNVYEKNYPHFLFAYLWKMKFFEKPKVHFLVNTAKAWGVTWKDPQALAEVMLTYVYLFSDNSQ